MAITDSLGATRFMNVSMWMTRDVLTVTPETPVAEAARIMAQKRVRRLLVVAPGETASLRGIISAKDVIHAFPPEVNPFAVEAPDSRLTPTTVGHIMTTSIKTVTPETPIEEVATLMSVWKIGALPVLRGKTLAGIITESDVFRAFVSMFSSDEPGARITFDATRDTDVFEMLGKLSQRRHVRLLSLVATHHDQLPVCVVRVAGAGVDKFLDDLWNSGHLIVNVIRFPRENEDVAG